MTNTKLIKDRITCLEYCDMIGIKLNKRNRDTGRGISPLRAASKNDTVFFVSNNFWHDFGSGEGGDVIDLCALYEFGGHRGEAIKKLAKLTGVEDDGAYNQWVEYTQNLNNTIQKWHEELTPEHIEYLHSRRITNETIERLKIGAKDNFVVIPFMKNGYVGYYTSRALPGTYKDSPHKKMSKDGLNDSTLLFGHHTLDRTEELLVITEGTFDALSFEQEGYALLATMGGSFSHEQLSTVRNICKKFKKVMIVFDNDAPGKKFTTTTARFLFANKINFVVGSVPDGFKDVNEFYSRGGDLSVIIDTAKDGVRTLIDTFKDDMDGFEKFAYQVARRMSSPEVELFFKEALTLGFDSAWLNAVKKICTKAPSQQSIADEVVSKYDIKYSPKFGFMEYNGRFWDMVPDEKIEGYVREEYGRYNTGSTQRSVCKIIMSMVLTDELFNQEPVMNFVNGTLEYYPEVKFREHRKEDNCTHCLNYPYDPNKRDERWIEFIETVTDGDILKQAALQEIMGFPLIPNNDWIQQAVCLIGKGSNGKSVYLKVLEKIYGEANRTSVPMSKLTQDFQVILLMNAMVNISGETKSNVVGAEDVFKQIIGGDTTTACYKGKDYVSFIPKVKFIMNANEFMKSSDLSDGWMRRWMFVRFPLSFVADPKLPHERKMDETLLDHFLQPETLSAIFNWALEGYMVLKETKRFTVPDDANELKEQYKADLEPLIIYVKELELPAPTYSIANEDFYKDYRAWCDATGHSRPLSRDSFLKRVAEKVREYRPDIERYHNGKQRGYRYIEEKQMEMGGF